MERSPRNSAVPLTVTVLARTFEWNVAVPLTVTVSAASVPWTSAVPATLKHRASTSPRTLPDPAIVTSPYTPPLMSPAPAILVFGLLVVSPTAVTPFQRSNAS